MSAPDDLDAATQYDAASTPKRTKAIKIGIQILFGIVVATLIVNIIYTLAQVSYGELKEKRNIDLSKIEKGFPSRRKKDTMKTKMADEYDRWFADLYRPSSVLSPSHETEATTSTAAYLRYGLESQSKLAWARAMFPAHLNVESYKMITVPLEDLPR